MVYYFDYKEFDRLSKLLWNIKCIFYSNSPFLHILTQYIEIGFISLVINKFKILRGSYAKEDMADKK